ncbi:MAG: RHS repeat-associated core domain-containing protein [Candidatus Acidiferrales bacterium]
MLGSSRSLTTSTGSLRYDADFYPFGGEHQFTNSCPQNYKFTGKERDAETGNDDYDARYYSSAYGRFLSADWSAIPAPVPYANLTNPQTLNLYAMVSDNPETFADLDGHETYAESNSNQGACSDAGSAACSAQIKKDAQESAQAQNTANSHQVGNIVHNETGGLRPEAKEGSGSSQDLHNAKVAISDVVKNREKSGVNGGVASDKVSSKERNTSQYKDAQQAAAQAARSPDVTGSSKHFYLDYGEKAPSWAAGKETTTYGPFKNAAGGGDVPKGAVVKIIIVHPEDQQ